MTLSRRVLLGTTVAGLLGLPGCLADRDDPDSLRDALGTIRVFAAFGTAERPIDSYRLE